METLPILSLTYKEKIDAVCKPLSNMGLKHFVMYLVFNDQTTLVLSNVYPILRSYYYEGLYREDFTYTPSMLRHYQENYYLCQNEQTFTPKLKELFARQYSIYPTYNIIRQHAECTFVFSAIRDKPTNDCQEFYNKTIKNFELFCSQFVNEFIDIIIGSNLNYKHAFILHNKMLRDAVIKQGYIEQPSISQREQDCLWYAAQGKSAKEIAQTLKISPATVETYLRHIREELHCNTTIEAVIEAMHRGIIGKLSPFDIRSEYSSCNTTYARPFAA